MSAVSLSGRHRFYARAAILRPGQLREAPHNLPPESLGPRMNFQHGPRNREPCCCSAGEGADMRIRTSRGPASVVGPLGSSKDSAERTDEHGAEPREGLAAASPFFPARSGRVALDELDR